MTDITIATLILIAVAVLVLLGLVWRVANYRECLEFGHSIGYCLAVAGR